MAYSIREAAEAAGVSKSTIQRRLKSGDLSKGSDGKIDPSELARIYPASAYYSQDEHGHEHSQTVPMGQGEHSQMNTGGTPELLTENAVLQVKLDVVQQIADDREKTIDHLRTELDTANTERREAQTKFTALLTDQRETEPAQPAPEKMPVNYPLWVVVVALFALVIWLMVGQG
jgi:hypothetical protein